MDKKPIRWRMVGDKPVPVYAEEPEEGGPVPKLPPPPAAADSVVPADVEEAWKVFDTVMVLAKGDRTVADQEFERVRERRITKRGRHGKDK